MVWAQAYFRILCLPGFTALPARSRAVYRTIMARLWIFLQLLKIVPVVIMAGFCFYQLHLVLNHRKVFTRKPVPSSLLSEQETWAFEHLRHQLHKNLVLQQQKEQEAQALQQKLKSLEQVIDQQKKQIESQTQQLQQTKQGKPSKKSKHGSHQQLTNQGSLSDSLQNVEVQGQRLSLHASVNLVPSVPPVGSTMDPRICLPLPKSPQPTTICIRDPATDPLLSGVILAGHLWEGVYVENMEAILKSYPGMGLVDIGSNLGVYTLMAAAGGKNILSVDMQYYNILHLQHSLQQSNLSSQVVLLLNAVYKDHNSKLSYQTYGNNTARSYIVENSKGTDTVQSVCLDDLIPLVPFQAVFMKIDLANTEHHVLMCGQEFLTRINVRVVQMKWGRKPPEIANWIGNFMHHYNYTASVLIDSVYHLWDVRFSNWTGDVFFFK